MIHVDLHHTFTRNLNLCEIDEYDSNYYINGLCEKGLKCLIYLNIKEKYKIQKIIVII